MSASKIILMILGFILWSPIKRAINKNDMCLWLYLKKDSSKEEALIEWEKKYVRLYTSHARKIFLLCLKIVC